MSNEILDYINSNLWGVWYLIGAALVFWMQAGFAMVEAGFTRAKNSGNIIMKNLMDFCIGTPTFWIVGFGIMFGACNGFFGKIGGIATEANYGSAMLPDGVPFWAFLIFQTVFCATSATISLSPCFITNAFNRLGKLFSLSNLTSNTGPIT